MKEAITEWSEIQEAANANAKNKLANKFSEEFSMLLKEEIENKNKSKKESYIKLDEAKESDKDDIESNEESVMKKQKETKKVVKESDENQPFEEKPKGVEVVKEEREKDFMGDLESDTPNQAKGDSQVKGDLYTDKTTTKQDSLANDTTLKEEFNITELDASSVGTALENAEDDDEVITMDEIEGEIAQLSLEEDLGAGVDAEKPTAGSDNGIAFDKLVSMRNQLDEMINGIGEQKNQGGKQSIPGRESGGPTTAMIDEEAPVEEQKNQGGKQSIPGRESGGPTQQMIDEESEEITDADVAAVLGSSEGGDEPTAEVDENLEHTQTHHNARKTGSQNHVNYGKESRLRDAMKNEGDKKIGSLIEENKKLTKNLNETKKYKKAVTKIVEQYKTTLNKYRNQLKEMATFNTNLANVNNLLVNEGLALTQEDKINIINEFKKVGTIAESQKKYKSILTELKDGKKTLTENIEDKVTASVAPSSKQSLGEAKEVTVYTDDKHILRIRQIMETIDGLGSKKII